MMNSAGRALASSGHKRVLFEDQNADDRFEALIALTSRTKLIVKLLGTDVAEQRIKEEMDRRLGQYGIKVKRPRGLGQTTAAKTFLDSAAERFEAAYLMALHFGSRGIGEYAVVETNFGRALDTMIEVYNHYRRTVPPVGDSMRIPFETYALLVEGLQSREIEVRQCGACNTKHPVVNHHQGPVHCPACSTQDLRMDEVRADVQFRITAYRQSRNQMPKFG